MPNCISCNKPFTKTGKNHKRCTSCNLEHKLNYSRIYYETHKTPGLGSGSTTGIAEQNHMFKHGRCVFRRWAKERLKQLDYCCEKCGTTIDVSARGNWAGHHIDHNSHNNTIDNLVVLCKKCHQVEHECWRAFQGVTTIPKGSTQEIVEAPTA